jgi:hypothetical protein
MTYLYHNKNDRGAIINMYLTPPYWARKRMHTRTLLTLYFHRGPFRRRLNQQLEEIYKPPCLWLGSPKEQARAGTSEWSKVLKPLESLRRWHGKWRGKLLWSMSIRCDEMRSLVPTWWPIVASMGTNMFCSLVQFTLTSFQVSFSSANIL